MANNKNILDHDFSLGTLNKKYKVSKEKFIAERQFNKPIGIAKFEDLDLDIDLDNIGTITDKIKQNYNNNYFNFMHANPIDDLNAIEQCIEWIKREWIFYQLLVIVSKCIVDKKFFKQVFNSETFREDIKNAIAHFKIGIFGSKNITSDIDVSISYSPYIKCSNDGNSVHTANPNYGVAYVVKMIENIFQKILHVSSLALDIEIYADYSLIIDQYCQEKYYLDISSFEASNFQEMLPSIFAGIVRNYLKGTLDEAQQQEQNNKNEILDKCKSEILTLFNGKYKWFNGNAESKAAKAFNTFNKILTKYVNKQILKKAINDGFDKVQNYNNSFNKTKIYYEKSKTAELESIRYINNPNKTNDDLTNLICEIGESLICREEGYISPLTVMDVVYNGQKNGNGNKEYESQFCENAANKPDIHCLLGNFGYIISMMEQLGYLFRFYLIYSSQNREILLDNQIYSKITKYLTRFNQSLAKYLSFNKIPKGIQQGGNYTKKRQIRKGYRRISSKARKTSNKKYKTKTKKY